MKTLLTTGMIAFYSILSAQLFDFSNAQYTMNRTFYSNGNPENEFFYTPLNANKSDILEKEHVKSVKCSVVDKKGEENHTYELTFNSKGKILTRQTDKATTRYEYLNDTLIKRIETINKKEVKVVERSYNDKNKLTFVQQTTNGKLVYQELYNYNDEGFIVKSQIIDLKKKKTYEMRYVYFERNKLKYQEFLINGKVKKTWTYECKEEGVRTDDKKSALESMCRYEEQSNDGSYILFFRQIKEGKDVLVKNYFSKDSIMYLSETFENDSIITNKTTFSKYEIHNIHYSKHNKVIYETIQKFNDKKQTLENAYLPKGKLRSKTTLNYNENGTISLYSNSNRKRVYSTTNYSYTFY